MSRTTVFVDLDGTLLTSDLVISPRTLVAIEAFPPAADIVIATGRSAPSALEIAAQLPRPAQPIIVCNGGAILDRDGSPMYVGEYYTRRQLDILTTLSSKQDNVGTCFYTPSTWYTAATDLETTRIMRHTEGEQRVVESFTDIAEPVVKVLFVSQDKVALARIETAIAALPEELTLLYSYSYCLEAMPASVSKGAAVQWLLDNRGIAASNAFAIGDGQNDVSMLSVAGTAFAPSNAHEDALAMTDHVVASNDDDGVAEALEIIAKRTGLNGPLRHVVFFRYLDSVSERAINESIHRFAALGTLIDDVAGFEWGVDRGVEGQDHGYTHGFILTFVDIGARDRYLVHPARVEFGNYVRPMLGDVIGLDFSHSA